MTRTCCSCLYEVMSGTKRFAMAEHPSTASYTQTHHSYTSCRLRSWLKFSHPWRWKSLLSAKEFQVMPSEIQLTSLLTQTYTYICIHLYIHIHAIIIFCLGSSDTFTTRYNVFQCENELKQGYKKLFYYYDRKTAEKHTIYCHSAFGV